MAGPVGRDSSAGSVFDRVATTPECEVGLMWNARRDAFHRVEPRGNERLPGAFSFPVGSLNLSIRPVARPLPRTWEPRGGRRRPHGGPRGHCFQCPGGEIETRICPELVDLVTGGATGPGRHGGASRSSIPGIAGMTPGRGP